MKNFIWLLSAVLITNTAQALSIDFTGTYRFEYSEIDKPSLGTPGERKSYGLNTLNLGAKIIASDGINIITRFDVFPNNYAAYRNSNLGAQFGGGMPRSPSTDADGSRTNVASQNQDSYLVRASQLYLNVNQEFGSLIVGRAPVHFGLGITYNAGLEPFDHWYTTRDMVGYKFIIDNFYFMPIMAKVYSGDPEQGNDISDQIFNFEYNNKETGALIGVWHQTRKSSDTSNDLIENVSTSKFAGTRTGGFNSQTVNFVLGRTWERFAFKVEASFLTGNTGVTAANNEEIKINSYGIASEFYFPNPESKWDFKLRAGIASGDDPSTTQYEGYQFNRNYDVATLLFNHRLGRRDFLTTGLIRDTNLGVHNSLDDEAIGNTVYFSPTVTYKWSDRLDLRNTLTYATLNVNPTGTANFSKDLGYEWDFDLIYRPRERVQWINQFALLLPGKAFKDGASNLENGATFGITTKAAISF